MNHQVNVVTNNPEIKKWMSENGMIQAYNSINSNG